MQKNRLRENSICDCDHSGACHAMQDAAPLRVVTTTTDLASLVTTVGGDKVEVEALVPGGFNADFYQPRPSDLFKVHRAKLFMQIGLGLEEWSRDLVNEANNSDLVKAQVSVGIPLMDVPKGTRRLQLWRYSPVRKSALPTRPRGRTSYGAERVQRALLYGSSGQGLLRGQSENV